MVLRSIPTRLSGRKSTNSSTRTSPDTSKPASPRIMNDTTLKLKVTAVKGRDLAAMDRNGFSDPYLVIALAEYRFTTEVQNKTLNPEWNDTFEMALSGTNSFNMVCVCWDKDRFGKDYMGEFNVSVNDLFANDSLLEERWFPLRSTRKKTKTSGEILLQFTLEDTIEGSTEEQTVKKWNSWVANVKGASASSDESTSDDLQGGERLDDEDDDDSENSEELAEQLEEAGVSGASTEKATTTDVSKKSKKDLKKKKSHKPFELFSSSDVVGVVFLEVGSVTDLPPEKNMTRTGFDMDPFVVVSLGKKVYRTKHIRHNLNPVYDEKMVFQVLRHEQNYSINFTVIDRDKLSGNDFVGEAAFSLQEIVATQPSPNPETGLYSLPTPSREDLTSSASGNGSKSRFRIPLSRSASGTNLAKKPGRVNSTKSSSNASLAPDQELDNQQVTQSPAPNKVAPVADTMDYDLQPFDLPLLLKNKDRWESKHSPEVHIKAKYVPYPALRQQFWRVMLKQYDADDSGEISRVELTTMLDTLGSTLTAKTIDSFFYRYMDEGETIDNKELTFDQAIICLEEKLNATSDNHSSALSSLKAHLPKLNLPGMEKSEEQIAAKQDDVSQNAAGLTPSDSETSTGASSDTLADSTIVVPKLDEAGAEGANLDDELAERDDKATEHVIQINECPLCHQPRLNKRSEVDIVTHLATCASQDWRSVDRLVMGGFVTASQAQRKWYSKVITKISYGGYKLGANSANILIQDRLTGQIQEERMSVYVRLGIRLLYKGMKSSNMENKKIRKLLESLSVKQGKKYDNPASAREIKGFIEFHQLNLDEVLLPLDEFKTFNEFFYRALKPGARPCSSPDNPKIIVSPADCRSVVFNQVSDATNIWIKGREFTIKRLLGDAYPEDVDKFQNGGLGIFRLAPQDYHRFHMPVDGIMGEPKLIKGEYYTVNPMAIRSALDVYGENVRILVPIDSPIFGRVMVICVGAMMVGSTVITAQAGSEVKRTDELGYFKFGGSTIVLLFENGKMRWDEDLIGNSTSALETLVRVGMAVGHSPDTVSPPQRKENVTAEDMADARRRIEGSLAPHK